jgi:hypothetical protein
MDTETISKRTEEARFIRDYKGRRLARRHDMLGAEWLRYVDWINAWRPNIQTIKALRNEAMWRRTRKSQRR